MANELGNFDLLKRFLEVIGRQHGGLWESLRFFVDQFARHRALHPNGDKIDQELCEVFQLVVRGKEILSGLSADTSCRVEVLLRHDPAPLLFPSRLRPESSAFSLSPSPFKDGAAASGGLLFPNPNPDFRESAENTQNQISRLLSQDVGRDLDTRDATHLGEGLLSQPPDRQEPLGQSQAKILSRSRMLFFGEPTAEKTHEATPLYGRGEGGKESQLSTFGNRLESLKYPRIFRSSKASKRERGTYNICSIKLKNEAIRISLEAGIKVAAEELKIPEKNIKRWIKQGPERKKGAGRKTMDPAMERGLLQWIADSYRTSRVFPDFKEVKAQAKFFSNNGAFKASKGWCDKFMRRNLAFFNSLRDEITHGLSRQNNSNAL